MVDIAARVWNHKWKIDPIVRSLIDTDFYKLLMCQTVLRNRPEARVTFSLINRSTQVHLADLIDEGELREQLDHVSRGWPIPATKWDEHAIAGDQIGHAGWDRVGQPG